MASVGSLLELPMHPGTSHGLLLLAAAAGPTLVENLASRSPVWDIKSVEVRTGEEGRDDPTQVILQPSGKAGSKVAQRPVAP